MAVSVFFIVYFFVLAVCLWLFVFGCLVLAVWFLVVCGLVDDFLLLSIVLIMGIVIFIHYQILNWAIMRDFRKLEIWKNGMTIVREVYQIAAQLPKEEKYGLRSQVTRSAVSVPSNIAEGCSRNSEVEFKRFLEIAIGSLFELETQLILISELNLISGLDITSFLDFITKEEKQMNSLISKISQNRRFINNKKRPGSQAKG